MNINQVNCSTGFMLECHRVLQLISHDKVLSLIWVKGNCSIQGNEEVDGLVRQGSKASFRGPKPVVPVALAFLNSLIRKCTHPSHKMKWDSLTTCRQAQETILQQSSKDCPQMSSLWNKKSRSQLRGIPAYQHLPIQFPFWKLALLFVQLSECIH